ncbi:MAG: hypothetical protein QM820_63790 [Minicystis sp.]
MLAPAPSAPSVLAPERRRGVQILAKSLFRDLLQNGFEVVHIVALSTELLDLTTGLIRDRSASKK